ncbi:DNA-directed RNA polymerase subunit beta [Nocardia takedensis]
MSADTVRSRCEYYRSVYHLPAVADPTSGLIGFRTGMVWAVEMPAELAQSVKLDLDRRLLGGGPIISHPRSARWTFLVRSDIPAQTRDDKEALWRNGIHLMTGGEQVALPTPMGCGVFYRAWINAPRSPFRFSGVAVVESARRMSRATSMAETTAVLPVLTAPAPV